MGKYKKVGTWWNDRDIQLIEKDGHTYALNGWNGEAYYDCWECVGKFNLDAVGSFTIQEIVNETPDGDFEVVDYNISEN